MNRIPELEKLYESMQPVNESLDLTIDWNSQRLIGNPQKPLVAEYMTGENIHNSDYGITITLDDNGGGKPLIWLKAWMAGDGRLSHFRSGSNFIEDTPENRLKIEKRYVEVIYALMKVKGHLPKKAFPYVKAIIEKPL